MWKPLWTFWYFQNQSTTFSTHRQHLTYPNHHFWLRKSLGCRMPEAGAGQGSSITCLLGSSAFLLVLYYTTWTFNPSCKLVLILKRTSSQKVLCKQRICSSAGSDIMLRATWSSNTATRVADASLCLCTITASRCPTQVPMENLIFFHFQSHTQAIPGIPLLTRWLHGNGRVRGREVVTGLLLHRAFLVAFFFFNWIWWLLQERGGVKNCILSDIDSLNGLKTRMVKFTSSSQNTLPNRY